MLKKLLTLFCLLIIGFAAYAQTDIPAPTPEQEAQIAAAMADPSQAQSLLDTLGIGLELGIGAENFGGTTYQTLTLAPDLSLGKFGIGLNIVLHYSFINPAGENQFYVLADDWVPDTEHSFLDLYLPKFNYIRFGVAGDPIYVKLGSINDATLGNGFIMGNYSNMLFMPDRRFFGLSFNLDGNLFHFPYVGIETFVSNLASFDLMGGRLFVRPLAWLDVPVISNLQVGYTLVADRDPYAVLTTEERAFYALDANAVGAPVLIHGADFRLPILSNDVISLVTFGDFVMQPQANGGMIGFGGKLFGFLTLGGQLRILGANFMPTYFDPTYDLNRYSRAQLVENPPTDGTDFMGWFVSLGTSVLEDQLVFRANLDGPFSMTAPSDTNNILNYPHLRAVFNLAEGLIPGVSLEASYDKYLIRDFASLINPTNAVIGARVSYKTGPVVLSLVYNLRYNPEATSGDPWEVTSSLETSIQYTFLGGNQ